MEIAGYSEFKSTQKLAAGIYIKWLNEQGILQHFSSPESIPTAIYKLNYTIDDHFILEYVFEFLSSFNVFSDAGGMYSLTSNIDKIVNKYYFDSQSHKTNPTYQFIQYGLSLLDERLMGGTGKWNLQNYNYLFERGYTQGSQLFYLNYLKTHINLGRFESGDDFHIGIYGSYPDVYIDSLFDQAGFASKHFVITPNKQTKMKAISYCEIQAKASKYSRNIHTIEEIGPNRLDLLIITNGIIHHYDAKSFAKFFSNMINSGGSLIMRNQEITNYMLGIEPLTFLHPHTFQKNGKNGIIKSLKSSSFRDVKDIGDKGLFLEVTRD